MRSTSESTDPTHLPNRIMFICLGGWDSVFCLRARCIGEHLQDSGWDVRYVIPNTPENAGEETDRVHRVSTSLLGFLSDCNAVIRRFDPTYLHFLNPELKASLLSARLRDRHIIGDWEDWHAVSRDRFLRRWVVRLSDAYMRRRSDVRIVTSRYLQSVFRDKFGLDSHYIPYAVLPRQFPALPNPFERRTAVYMGGFYPHMDHDIVLDAARILRDRGCHVPIRMIGHGTDWERSKAFCERHGLSNVEMPGFLDWNEMLNCLVWADALLFPIRDTVANRSRCPFKLFQYAQARRPIITCRVGEVSTFLGDQAWYVNPEPEAFADAIQDSFRGDRPEDVEYGIDQHTWRSRANDFETALCEFSSERACAAARR